MTTDAAEYFRRMMPTWRRLGVTSVIVTPDAHDELVAAGMVTANPTATGSSGRVRYRLSGSGIHSQTDEIGRQLP